MIKKKEQKKQSTCKQDNSTNMHSNNKRNYN